MLYYILTLEIYYISIRKDIIYIQNSIEEFYFQPLLYAPRSARCGTPLPDTARTAKQCQEFCSRGYPIYPNENLYFSVRKVQNRLKPCDFPA